MTETDAATWAAFQRGQAEDADRLEWHAGALAAHRGQALWKGNDAFVAGWEQGKREVAAAEAEARWAGGGATVTNPHVEWVVETLAAHKAEADLAALVATLDEVDWAVAA